MSRKSTSSTFYTGTAGEMYVRRHIQQLLAHGFLSTSEDTSKDFVEGGDNRVIYNRFGEEVDMSEFNLDNAIDIQGKGYKIVKHLVGGLEIKTIYNFTFRNNDNNEPSGTLPFELWNSDRYGWLLALLNPEMRLKPGEEQSIHAVQPVLFCFLLISYLGPFACVMFEDFPALAQRLEDLAAEKGFQLIPQSETNPDGIPPASDADTWRHDDPYIIDDCWHVQFNRLSDLATVTLIGRSPLVKRSIQLNDNDDYIQLQKTRCNYLLQCAGKKIISEDIESRTDFYPRDSNYLFADILNNLDIIADLDEQKYPYLYKALKTLGMRNHLNSILYNMYSHETITSINSYKMWFLQTKKYLREWSRECNITGSSFSWQSHIIFLTDAGLLKKYVEVDNAYNLKVYRSVPKYSEGLLETADEKAKAYIAAGIKLNNFTKAEVIKVSGQDRADFLYYDDERIISGIKEEVDSVFIETAREILSTSNHVTPDRILTFVSEIISHKYWIDPFDNDHDSIKEKHSKQAQRALNRIKLRYEELSKLIPCQYRELTRELDSEKFSEPS